MKKFLKSRWFLYALIAVVLAIPLWISYTGFFVWSPLNCWHYDVDIKSGRIRYSRFFLYMKVKEEISDSVVTKTLQRMNSPNEQPDWRRALTLSPGIRHSPHYRFHSAKSQIRQLEVLWDFADFTPAARKRTAEHLLVVWQKTDSDDGASTYLTKLSELAFAPDTEGKRIDESDVAALE